MEIRNLFTALIVSGFVGSIPMLPLNAQDAAETAQQQPLIQSDFEKSEGLDWPAGWPRNDDTTWETENGNSFLRIRSSEPGKLIMLYREIAIPRGVEALELSWKQRITGLERGENSWFDARIIMEYMDSGRAKVSPNPPTASRNRDTDGWEERSVKFNVPEDARILKFMPSLFRVKAGTFDLDEVVLRPIPKLAPEDDPATRRQIAAQERAADRSQQAQQRLSEEGSLIQNGNFERQSRGAGRPDGWGAPRGNVSYETEEGNTFLRIKAAPGEMSLVHRIIDIPQGVEALELSWRWRVSDLRPGPEPWFDARFMMKFQDAGGKQVNPSPSPPYTRRSTDGWVERSSRMLVPEGAVALEFMPTLFRVRSGVMDIDNLSLKPIDATELHQARAEREAERARLHVEPEAPNEANWPSELKVVGNRLHDEEGNEVWLQGLNIASLEWNPRGENVMKSAQVSLETWKANVIRLPVKEEYWFDERLGEDYRTLVDNFIIYTANRGAYVVLDLHRYRAPIQVHADFWKDAATRYKNHPAVLFDLINEPHSTSWEVWRNGGFVEQKRDGAADEDHFLTEEERQHNKQGFMSIGMQALLDAVREVGANNIVVVGGLDWAYDLSGILNGYALDEHENGNGIMYSTHVYPWKSGWQRSFLDAAEHYPLLVGEVGADANKMDWMPHDRQEDWDTWVPDMIGVIQKYRLNWTAWCFHPRASPRMLLDWNYTPTPFWGQQVKDAIQGKEFELKRLR